MNCRATLILFFAATVLLSAQVTAQSGRQRPASPTPTPAASQPKKDVKGSTVEAESSKTPALSAEASILVVGQIVHGYAYYSSSYLDSALKECVYALSMGRRSLKPIRGGKMDYTQAKERAKLNTEDRVLWISFVTSDDGMGNTLISYAEYALLGPGRDQVLTRGRIDPAKSGVLSRGGIIGLPSGHPRQTRGSMGPTMKSIAREVSSALLRGGWFDR